MVQLGCRGDTLIINTQEDMLEIQEALQQKREELMACRHRRRDRHEEFLQLQQQYEDDMKIDSQSIEQMTMEIFCLEEKLVMQVHPAKYLVRMHELQKVRQTEGSGTSSSTEQEISTAPKKGHPPGFETQVPGRMASDMANHKASGRSEAGRRELSTRAAQVLYQPGAARRRSAVPQANGLAGRGSDSPSTADASLEKANGKIQPLEEQNRRLTMDRFENGFPSLRTGQPEPAFGEDQNTFPSQPGTARKRLNAPQANGLASQGSGSSSPACSSPHSSPRKAIGSPHGSLEKANAKVQKREEQNRRLTTGRFEVDFPGLRTGQPEPVFQEDQNAFPSLGNGPAPIKTGVWGSNSQGLKERLADGKPLTRLGPSATAQQPVQGVEEFERQSGLRHPNDNTTDIQHRRELKSKTDFRFIDTNNRGGRPVNILEGLELHNPVLNNSEQVIMEAKINDWVKKGLRGELKGRTFSAPRKWARGKGRITVQFGCCYNYARDQFGRMPGIIAEEVVEAMPPILVALAQRLVRWGIIPKDYEPDSAIVNIYEVDDCIPPHIDHHDFSRPFCTISLLSEEEIMFGTKLVPESAGVFHGVNNMHVNVPLPTGSCLILKGNGADVAMHCVPPVKRRRMSITLRKMGDVHAAKVQALAAKAMPSSRSSEVNHGGRWEELDDF